MTIAQVHSMLFLVLRSEMTKPGIDVKFHFSLPLELVIAPHYPEIFTHRSEVHLYLLQGSYPSIRATTVPSNFIITFAMMMFSPAVARPQSIPVAISEASPPAPPEAAQVIPNATG